MDDNALFPDLGARRATLFRMRTRSWIGRSVLFTMRRSADKKFRQGLARYAAGGTKRAGGLFRPVHQGAWLDFLDFVRITCVSGGRVRRSAGSRAACAAFLHVVGDVDRLHCVFRAFPRSRRSGTEAASQKIWCHIIRDRGFHAHDWNIHSEMSGRAKSSLCRNQSTAPSFTGLTPLWRAAGRRFFPQRLRDDRLGRGRPAGRRVGHRRRTRTRHHMDNPVAPCLEPTQKYREHVCGR